MSDLPCPCALCNGELEPTDYLADFDPLEEGVLTWDSSLPETMHAVAFTGGELWPGHPFPERKN